MLGQAGILILILQAKWFAQGQRSSVTTSIAASMHIAASIATIHFNKFLILFRYNAFLPHSSFVCHPLGYDYLEA